MYREIYEDPKPTLEVSIIQLLMISVVVLVLLVLPAQWIYSQRLGNEDTTTAYTVSSLQEKDKLDEGDGRVAGFITEEEALLTRIPFTNTYIDLQSEAVVLSIGGVLLLGVSMILLVYLLLTSNRNKS